MASAEIPAQDAVDLSTGNLAIITYSSNLQPGSWEVQPSALSWLVADAARAGWGEAETRFVIAGETSFPSISLDSTGDLIADDLIPRGIDDERVEVINTLTDSVGGLNNTAVQIRALAEALDSSHHVHLGMAMSFHIPRLIRYAKAYGLQMDFVAADDFVQLPEIQERMSEDEIEEHQLVLGALPEFAKREKHVRRLSYFDRKGKLLNLLTAAQGPRLHDVNPETGQAILTTTRKRLEEAIGPEKLAVKRRLELDF
jgi:hypothetical protein